jgi:hypothetical protein
MEEHQLWWLRIANANNASVLVTQYSIMVHIYKRVQLNLKLNFHGIEDD